LEDEKKTPARDFGNLWNSLPTKKRALVILALVATLGLVGFAVISARSLSYSVLFSGLSPKDAGDIVADLQTSSVPYRIAGSGTIIEVPSDRVNEARLSAASKGLLRDGSVGFEIFDGQSFGTTSFVEQLNYRRGLQGELARTIAGLDSVASARVHIAMGERAVFEDKDTPPSASVALKLGSNRLSRTQVRGIANLVASSVDGLGVDRVTIIDDQGNSLSRDAGNQSLADDESTKAQLEKTLSTRVRSLLEKVVGKRHVAVAVTALLNHRSVDEKEEIYDPKQTAVRSESRTVGSADGKTVGGLAGVRGNLPGAPAATKSSLAGGGSLQETRNYEVSRVVRHTKDPSSTVKRLHVAVLVDFAKDEEGNPVERTKEQLDYLGAIAREAAGIDKARGDSIEVRNVPFSIDASADEATIAAGENASALPPVSVMAAGAAGALLLIVGVVFAMTRKKRPPTNLGLPARVSELEAALNGTAPVHQLGAARDASAIHDRVTGAVQQDTGRAARVISEWMAETKSEAA